jgi:hypothetical protein
MARKSKLRTSWVVLDGKDNTFKCLRCGETRPLGLPKEVRQLAKESEGFAMIHQFCKEKP